MYLPAIQPFKLELRWLQAQAFRWDKRDGWYYGFVGGALIRIREHDDGLEFESDVPEESLRPSVERYFRLDQDIESVHESLRRADDTGTMARLIDRYGGMRILRQDPWECLVAYICSRRMRVERTSAAIEKLARPYGRELTLDCMTMHSFPEPRRLAEVAKAERDKWNLGLGREDLIHKVATHIASGGLDLNSLRQSSHDEARRRLMQYTGIGWKIADCVCLFSLDKQAAFPIDGNIAKALAACYEKAATVGAANARLMEWARKHFGPNAGYAGQLLFLDQYQGA